MSWCLTSQIPFSWEETGRVLFAKEQTVFEEAAAGLANAKAIGPHDAVAALLPDLGDSLTVK